MFAQVQLELQASAQKQAPEGRRDGLVFIWAEDLHLCEMQLALQALALEVGASVNAFSKYQKLCIHMVAQCFLACLQIVVPCRYLRFVITVESVILLIITLYSYH